MGKRRSSVRLVGLSALAAAAALSSPALAQVTPPAAQQPYPQQQPQQPPPPAGQAGQPAPYPPPAQPPPGQYPPGQYPPPYPYPPGQYPPPYPYPPGQYPPPQYPYPSGYPPPYPQYQPYVPPPAGPPAPPRPPGPRKRGLFAMGYLGFQHFQGRFAAKVTNEGADTGLTLGIGPHVGGMIGYRFIEQVSVNAEVSLDIPHAELAGSYTSIQAERLAFSVSPLYHIDAGAVDFMIGPKLGFWTSTFSQSDSLGTATLNYNGWMAGVTAGLYYKVGKIGLGGFTSFDYAPVFEGCATDAFSQQSCGPNKSFPADKLLSFALAVLF